ncbi:uncharacterized protein LOC126893611 isoform X2 [Daktulosphaira vitifoliae]|uniref:uncharacterized protein LOC126893611 isoform X2 n=1 Tax=Daktulosphaira vitifoliae TaxID=58002 RepID=UPI0021AAE459|nr:uncharacterized protein LOC126893611 isoform X2 [Daktulosphaira vitifoliae]
MINFIKFYKDYSCEHQETKTFKEFKEKDHYLLTSELDEYMAIFEMFSNGKDFIERNNEAVWRYLGISPTQSDYDGLFGRRDDNGKTLDFGQFIKTVFYIKKSRKILEELKKVFDKINVKGRITRHQFRKMLKNCSEKMISNHANEIIKDANFKRNRKLSWSDVFDAVL